MQKFQIYPFLVEVSLSMKHACIASFDVIHRT